MSVINLNDHSLLQISGSEAKQFLQGQLTCDMNEVKATYSILGAHCNPKGRVLSFFRLFQRQQDYYLLMPSNVIEQALAGLRKYALFSKVELNIIQPQCYGIFDLPKNIHFPENDHQVIHHQHYTNIRIPGKSARYCLIDFTNTLKLNIVNNITRWHQLDMEIGIPRLYPQTIGEFLPHYLNLPQLNAVSFNKGCFTGQEIIARMQHRGKLKQHMRLRYLITHQTIPPATKCFTSEDKNIGQIIDSINLDTQQLCLILLRDDFSETNELVIAEQKIVLTTK